MPAASSRPALFDAGIRAVLETDAIAGVGPKAAESDVRRVASGCGLEQIRHAPACRRVIVFDAVPALAVGPREDVVQVGISHQRPKSLLVGGYRLLDLGLLLGRPYRTAVAAVGSIGMPIGRSHRSRAEFVDRAAGLPVGPRTNQGRKLHRRKDIGCIVKRLPGIDGIVSVLVLDLRGAPRCAKILDRPAAGAVLP